MFYLECQTQLIMVAVKYVAGGSEKSQLKLWDGDWVDFLMCLEDSGKKKRITHKVNFYFHYFLKNIAICCGD